MQMLVEGLAMGAFATVFKEAAIRWCKQADAAGDDRRGLPPQVRKDLGRPHHPEARRQKSTRSIEDWAAQCFQALLFNLGSPDQKAAIYQRSSASIRTR